MSREVNLVLGSAGAISLLIITPLINWNLAVGAAINLLMIETFVTCGFFFFLCKKLGFKRVWKGLMKFFRNRSFFQ